MKADRALLVRAAAGREAVSFGADPALTLALVVWPPKQFLEAVERAGRDGRLLRLRGRRPSPVSMKGGGRSTV